MEASQRAGNGVDGGIINFKSDTKKYKINTKTLNCISTMKTRTASATHFGSVVKMSVKMSRHIGTQNDLTSTEIINC